MLHHWPGCLLFPCAWTPGLSGTSKSMTPTRLTLCMDALLL
ncbi:mCG1041741 [Mus musculus]|nr:mCG1041741 [Mus musculus]